MKTKQNHKISKQALILASISLIAATIIVPAIAAEGESSIHKVESETHNEFVLSTSVGKTVMIIGGEQAQFVPQTIQVSLGDSIVFINQDGSSKIPHAIVSVDSNGVPTGEFESDILYVGDTFEVSFDEIGVYRYVNSIHPETSGIIAVI